MTDEHKFQLTAKLNQDVLAGVVDDVMPFDVETGALLQDTLVILSSKVNFQILFCKICQYFVSSCVLALVSYRANLNKPKHR